MRDVDEEKRVAAEAAADLVSDGMTVGLGGGSTVAYLLPALARRARAIRCVPASPRTAQAAREHGLALQEFRTTDRLDVTIDGADQVAGDGWLVKGAGGAHTREKITATAAERFVVIADSTKPVDAVRAPIPIEVVEYGFAATLRLVQPAAVRDAPRSPDGGVLADYQGVVDDPERLATWLSEIPGIVEHGLFPPDLVTDVLIGRAGSVQSLR